MSIYQPYFYIIQEVSSGMYYVGAKWGKDSDPRKFMIIGGYTTSSKAINKLVEKHGIKSFIIRRIKTFKTPDEAYAYETRFLQKVDAKNHPNFYNAHNNDNIPSPEKLKMINKELYGVEYPFMSPVVQKSVRQTVKTKYGVTNVSQIEEIKKKKLASRKHTESLMSREELNIHRLKTNSKISKTFREKTCSEKQAIAKRISETKSNTPEEIKKDRIERMKRNQDRKEMAEKQKETLSKRVSKKCPHCELSTKNYSNYTRWHGDNCKYRK